MIRKTDLPQPIVAINIGSSGIRAIAADYDERHETFHILGSEYSTYRHPCIEKGVVQNSSDIGFMVNETWKKLCNRVGRGELKNIFVCVGGQSLQSVHVEAHRQQRRSEIRQKMLSEMIQECSLKIERSAAEAGVLSVLPERWDVDGESYDNLPVDVVGKDITLYATAFVMRKAYSTKIDDMMRRTGLTIYDRELVPDACITALTVDEEREKGCAVIDMGAQTTTLTVYKNNQFYLTKVKPLGGYDVTHDIETIGITPQDAEKLKCKFGTLSLKPDLVDRSIANIPSAREGEEPVSTTYGNLCSIIAWRINETVIPLLEEIKRVEDIRIIYLTGGASMLRGIVPFLSKKTNIPVKYATHAQYLAHDTEDEYYKPLYGTLVGTLLLGQEYMSTHPDDKPGKEDWLGKIKETMGMLFGGEEMAESNNKRI